MTDLTAHPLIGKWRFVEHDLWSDLMLDFDEPAYIAFDADGTGRFAIGAATCFLGCRFAAKSVRFTWQGFDDGMEITGSGSARLRGDNTITGELAIHLGDAGRFKAYRWE